MVLQSRRESERVKLSGPITVGKDILELLSTAMYVNPLSIYREYVQNAADSLDQAEGLGLRTANRANPEIEIVIDPAARSVLIRDSGAGVSRGDFNRTLTAIGGSGKRGSTARGFRGVGRFAGLGSCQELVMRSRAAGDSSVTTMHWDCRLLKERLRDPKEQTLESIFSDIVGIGSEPAAKYPCPFFEVEMRNVLRYKNDVLLNETALRLYLSQVAPVGFDPSFSFGAKIVEFLGKYKAGKAYSISINGRPVTRPFQDRSEAKPKVNDKFSAIEFFDVQGFASEIDAVGWILHSNYLGAIPERHGISGLRLRVGNMQVGDGQMLVDLFPEPRFNSWTVGECHVLSSKLVPNARRDNFDQSNHYNNLTGQLTLKAKSIAKACREHSARRARERVQREVTQNVNGHSVDWGKTKTFFAINGAKPLSKNHKKRLAKLLNNGRVTYSELIGIIVSSPTDKVYPRASSKSNLTFKK